MKKTHALSRIIDKFTENDNTQSNTTNAPAVADLEKAVRLPFLLKGTLRSYQQGKRTFFLKTKDALVCHQKWFLSIFFVKRAEGLEWLAAIHRKRLNGILADEMGLGKTVMTICLLAWMACEEGDWGPHLIVVPTSVMLNWEMEFKRFCPAFKVNPKSTSL